MFSPDECETAIQNFIEIVKFPTVSFDGPDGSYLACANWIVEKLHELNIDACILEESRKGHPVVVGQWTGEDPTLPAILLNSHYDVVPIVADMWTVPAFEGYRKDGRVYGRGTQDMKCVCVQYLEALRKLKKNSYKPKRTILLSYVPDEEVGGGGMADLIRSKWYKERTIGLALDEGLSSAADEYTVFFGERYVYMYICIYVYMYIYMYA
jgi:aminoacylase